MKYIEKYLAFMALPVKNIPDPCIGLGLTLHWSWSQPLRVLVFSQSWSHPALFLGFALTVTLLAFSRFRPALVSTP